MPRTTTNPNLLIRLTAALCALALTGPAALAGGESEPFDAFLDRARLGESSEDAPDPAAFRAALMRQVTRTAARNLERRKVEMVGRAQKVHPRTELASGRAVTEDVRAVGALSQSKAAEILAGQSHQSEEAMMRMLSRYDGRLFVAKGTLADVASPSAARAVMLVGLTPQDELEVILQGLEDIDGRSGGFSLEGYQDLESLSFGAWARSLQG